jgi:hypothetical protein
VVAAPTDQEILRRLGVLEEWRGDVNGSLQRLEKLARRRVMTEAQKRSVAHMVLKLQQEQRILWWRSWWARAAASIGVIAGLLTVLASLVYLVSQAAK